MSDNDVEYDTGTAPGIRTGYSNAMGNFFDEAKGPQGTLQSKIPNDPAGAALDEFKQVVFARLKEGDRLGDVAVTAMEALQDRLKTK